VGRKFKKALLKEAMKLMKVEAFIWEEFDDVAYEGGMVAGVICGKIRILRKNKDKSSKAFKQLALDIDVPIGLARKMLRQKTEKDAFELWRMTNLKDAFKALKNGKDIGQVKAETELSMSALNFLKSMDAFPKKEKRWTC
jgi:hypothetical protein